MARSGLQVAVLSLLCLVAVVTSDDVPQVPPALTDAEICTRFFDEDSKMTFGAVYNMLFLNFPEYFKLGQQQEFDRIKKLLELVERDHDMHLDLSECQQLITYIKLGLK